MAAITPVAETDSNYVDPKNATVESRGGLSTTVVSNDNPRRRTFYFSAVSAADTWTADEGFPGVSNCYFVTTAAAPSAVTYVPATRTFTFLGGGGVAGYLIADANG